MKVPADNDNTNNTFYLPDSIRFTARNGNLTSRTHQVKLNSLLSITALYWTINIQTVSTSKHRVVKNVTELKRTQFNWTFVCNVNIRDTVLLDYNTVWHVDISVALCFPCSNMLGLFLSWTSSYRMINKPRNQYYNIYWWLQYSTIRLD